MQFVGLIFFNGNKFKDNEIPFHDLHDINRYLRSYGFITDRLQIQFKTELSVDFLESYKKHVI